MSADAAPAALEPRLAPPAAKPRLSVARPLRYWYVACRSAELRDKPLQRTILGIPLVLFRTEGGEPGALLDRCPHRNVPLSLGRRRGEHLQCGYHGWEFDRGGACRGIPGLCGEDIHPAWRVASFRAHESDGFVWVFMAADEEPHDLPYRLPHAGEAGYTTARREVRAAATLHAAVENALDVPHTAYLHAGLFRGGGRTNPIEAIVRRGADRVEAEYVGEPRPEGLAGKILAPRGGVVTHYDRFILPSIAQVEYRLGDKSHILVTSLCTPVTDFDTRMYAVISFRLPIPGWLVRPFLEPIAKRIFAQDATILRAQSESVQRFGGEQYVSTELDLLGGQVWRLLRQAERGELAPPDSPMTEVARVQMRV